MPREDWQRVKEIFHEVLTLDLDSRERFLAEACSGEPELRQEIDSLLEAHEQSGGLLEEPAFGRLFPVLHAGLDERDDADSWMGRRLGAYRITAEIGRGGMSKVFRAQRDDGQFEQQVAVKILRPGYVSRAFIERFLSERQVLAGFNHPHIARLLDGGCTEDGGPFLVMEYVEGRDLFDYCKARELGVRRRLELFRTLCGAVQYVHQRLTIHGDLKCRNVLVTTDGVVKLLDFGLAKLLGVPDGSTGQVIDGSGVTAMTPLYASPEQLRGEPLTTATDIYSLGVMLYRLLTGELPARTSEPELDRSDCVRSSGLTPPSEMLRSRPEFRHSAQLRRDYRELRGDLDSIIMQALHSDPAQRYSSVEQLSEDIRRHLECLPILSRESSLSDQVRKFVRRHTLAVSFSGLVVVLLAITCVTMSWQAHVIGIERARAERRFNDVRKLADTLIFDIHDAINELPGAARTRHLLIETALHYLDSLSREAGGDPALQRELAAAYLRLGDVQGRAFEASENDYAGAVKSYRRSYALLESTLATKSSDPAIRRDLIVNCGKLSDLLWHTGDASGALSFSEQTVLNSERLAASAPSDRSYQELLARSQGDYAYKLFEIHGKTTDALGRMNRSIITLQSLSRSDPENRKLTRTLSLSYGRAAEMLASRGQYAHALSMNLEAYRLLEQLSQASPENTDLTHLKAFAEHDIAQVLLRMGRLDEARHHASAALDAFRSLAAAEPKVAEYQVDVGKALAELAEIALRSDKPVEANGLLEEALATTAALPPSARSNGYFRLEEAAELSLMGAVHASLAEARGREPEFAQSCERARQSYQKALAIYRELSQTWAEAATEVARIASEPHCSAG